MKLFQIRKLISFTIIALALTGCSNRKEGMTTLGSLSGVIIAASTGKNILVGSVTGGLVGNIAGQVTTQAMVSKRKL